MRRTSLIQQIAPWLIWTLFFTTLAMVARHRGDPGPVSNPRSLSGVAFNTATPARPAPMSDCRGETLSERGVAREQKQAR